MGGPLGSTLVMLFMYALRRIAYKNCPSDLKRYYYRWYVDDIFVLFVSPEHLLFYAELYRGRGGRVKWQIFGKKLSRSFNYYESRKE